MEAIYAIDDANGLAKDGSIPWKSKKDMQFFYETTKNHVVVMGKNTYLSLPSKNRPLKERYNIVLTNNPEFFEEDAKKYENVHFTKDDEKLHAIFTKKDLIFFPQLKSDYKIFIIGGKMLYEKYIPMCKTIWVTQIKKNYDCDLFFAHDLEDFQKEVIEENDELKIVKYFQYNQVGNIC